MLRIEPAVSRRHVRQFVELPYRLHAVDPHWVPPLRRDEYARFSPRHPFFEHGDITLWLAIRDGHVVGRIAAIDDRRHNETHGERVTWFGFMDAVDAEIMAALLAEVERHGRGCGSAVVRGPANPSLNETAGLLIDGFDTDPYIQMPHNPKAYPGFVEAAGYRKVKDLYAWHLDLAVPLPERVARMAERVRRRHDVSVRSVDMRAFAAELTLLQRIYERAWHQNWGFVPPTDAEMRKLASDLRPVLDPSLVIFAEIRGRAVACAVAVPDLNQVLKRMGGRLWPFGIFQVLRRRSLVDQGRLLLLGVEPEAQRLGLYPLLISEIHRRGVANGYRRAELSWTLEDNDAINAGIEAAGAHRYKTYRIYERALAT